jgi:hypothetical protein
MSRENIAIAPCGTPKARHADIEVTRRTLEGLARAAGTASAQDATAGRVERSHVGSRGAHAPEGRSVSYGGIRAGLRRPQALIVLRAAALRL